jgi:restriction system protein
MTCRPGSPSGTPLLADRLHWAVAYMYQAGLLSRPKRAVARITGRGRTVAAAHPDRVDLQALSEFPEFIDFQSRSRQPRQAAEPDLADDGATPREAVSSAVDKANAAVAAEVLDRVQPQRPLLTIVRRVHTEGFSSTHPRWAGISGGPLQLSFIWTRSASPRGLWENDLD